MVKILRGVIRGRTIELEAEPGIEDGRRVEVVVRSKTPPGPPPLWRPGGTETAAGMMAGHWTEDDDRILDEIERERHRPSTREVPA
ncbi:MAG TPA: hypothetical protein VG406_14405 [Isosphaeraceae bacterium]|jgi:hypothetical protein|nr:hypothetical protein [Isosphaeraceae bacterium]